MYTLYVISTPAPAPQNAYAIVMINLKVTKIQKPMAWHYLLNKMTEVILLYSDRNKYIYKKTPYCQANDNS